jgi:hypothetical protein
MPNSMRDWKESEKLNEEYRSTLMLVMILFKPRNNGKTSNKNELTILSRLKFSSCDKDKKAK